MSSRFDNLQWLAQTLLIVGGINWGLLGLFNFDFVAFLFGPLTLLSKIVYIMIGLSALYVLYFQAKVSEIAQPRLA
ncbi:MAG: DUF378 domain-containing protein [bacterium]|nr:DUF378 domain-containing protein [bacterium]